MRRGQLCVGWKPRERGGQGEQPRRNRVRDPRLLPLAATETRQSPSLSAAALRKSAEPSCFSEPERLPEPAIPAAASGRPGGRRAGIQLVWRVGSAGLRASNAGGKQGPRSQEERGCGPSATPAPLPTWRPRPRGVSVYADGGGP